MLIATKALPEGVAAILARQGEQTVVALAADLSVVQVVAAENMAFNRAGPSVVIYRRDIGG